MRKVRRYEVIYAVVFPVDNDRHTRCCAATVDLVVEYPVRPGDRIYALDMVRYGLVVCGDLR